MAEFKYEIIEKVGVISQSAKGWSKELNFISWNEREPKFDIREWSEDHSQMSKGISLSKAELIALRDILNDLKL
ncbi:MAG: hypothetical protein E7312_07350 [Clostridiales bacterium]|nr:hypothetical protein [Clostridiales bacterium]